MAATKIATSSGFSGSGQTDHWKLIACEIIVCFIIIYASIHFDLMYREYLRFIVFLPLYQAGLAYGVSGGALCGIAVTLLFLPGIARDPQLSQSFNGWVEAFLLILLVNLFSIFVAGAIGRQRRARERVDRLSDIFLRIGGETTERGIMERLGFEALSLIDARQAAVLFRDRDQAQEDEWRMLLLDAARGDATPAQDIPQNHPLKLVVRERKSLWSDTVASDNRFLTRDGMDEVRNMLAVPVKLEQNVYGALMLVNKRDDDGFRPGDAATVRVLTGAAGAAINDIELESERQEQQMREQRMKELFSRFVSSSVADYVLENPDLLKGRWQEVTVLVSDIRGFTTLSEHLPANRLVEQLNEYFSEMVDVIFKHHGAIDKFIGDCIVAYWGAPAPDEDHARNAARAAVNMAAALDALNARWADADKQPFHTGIGLHTCRVLVGNVGDDRKKAFTIMGEEVRHAMKLESYTKDYQVRIIASAKTAENISEIFTVQKLSPLGGHSEELFEVQATS